MTSNIPASPGVDLCSRKDGEPGGNERFPHYRPLVGILTWLSIMTRPDIANALRACTRYSNNLSPRHKQVLLYVTACVDGSKEIGLKIVRGSGLSRFYVYQWGFRGKIERSEICARCCDAFRRHSHRLEVFDEDMCHDCRM